MLECPTLARSGSPPINRGPRRFGRPRIRQLRRRGRRVVDAQDSTSPSTHRLASRTAHSPTAAAGAPALRRPLDAPTEPAVTSRLLEGPPTVRAAAATAVPKLRSVDHRFIYGRGLGKTPPASRSPLLHRHYHTTRALRLHRDVHELDSTRLRQLMPTSASLPRDRRAPDRRRQSSKQRGSMRFFHTSTHYQRQQEILRRPIGCPTRRHSRGAPPCRFKWAFSLTPPPTWHPRHLAPAERSGCSCRPSAEFSASKSPPHPRLEGAHPRVAFAP